MKFNKKHSKKMLINLIVILIPSPSQTNLKLKMKLKHLINVKNYLLFLMNKSNLH